MAEQVKPFEASERPTMENFNARIAQMNSALEEAGSGPYYATCATPAGTTAKTAVCEGFGLRTGAAVLVKFTYTNTAATPTLNVNGSGAKYIKSYGTFGYMNGLWEAGSVFLFGSDDPWYINFPEQSYAQGFYLNGCPSTVLKKTLRATSHSFAWGTLDWIVDADKIVCPNLPTNSFVLEYFSMAIYVTL